ncbi:hypothetical protein ES703_24927 [subsurface metagenome]
MNHTFGLRRNKHKQTQFQTGYLTALRSVAQDKSAQDKFGIAFFVRFCSK